ncbi:MAG: DEAD/DEAH box helicase [Polyangiaceae bacterium]
MLPSKSSPDTAARPSPAFTVSDFADSLGPELCAALAKKGYDTLTPVQASVLDSAHSERDLRVSSQTGSGKTLAIGFALRAVVAEHKKASSASATLPSALVIVPTRELAKQVQDELAWLYAPMKQKVAAVTGGASYRDEHRALAGGPALVVGTPGRLLDHLNRGSIQAAAVRAVVLDEADRMLDLGFREELEAILQATPAERLTHLVSATFSREVKALADRFQKEPFRVEGTPLGSANTDIEHIIYLVPAPERIDALVNVLLYHPEEQTLVFARTRAEVADITRELQSAGFAAGSLSGEMEQAARNRALSAFKSGAVRALVATDVAARGIDVQDIARVVQIDPPNDADTYTHRSGRTGRAGRKGVSALIVPPQAMRRTVALLERAKVRYRVQPVPNAASIRAAQDERWLAELTAESEAELPERIREQVARIVRAGLTERALGLLLQRSQVSQGEPRDITPIDQQQRRPRPDRMAPPPARSERSERAPREARAENASWVPFRVSWGEAHGADPRRLVAMLCRRGQIESSAIGAIRVGRTASTVEVSSVVAAEFAAATRAPDKRDPRIIISPASSGPPAFERPPARSPRGSFAGATKPSRVRGPKSRD